MATFLQGVTDTRPEQHLYQPDYNFLTTVMGGEQRKYDQGFAKVKSVYNSMLNSAVTNGENEQFRTDMFKKLETQMRSIAKVDLGQGSNVLKAKALFDPLTQDKDLIADMAKTAYINSESAKADAAMNSSDPVIRRTYNQLSRQDIEHGRQDLQNAKRLDGSIEGVRTNGFTAFEDVDDFLSKRAKADGFKIVSNSIRGHYLVKTTNGPGHIPDYEAWSHSAMGNQFDRQFNVEARVGLESQIRGRLKAAGEGVTRADITNQIAAEQQTNMLTDLQQKKAHRTDELDHLNTALAQMEHQSKKRGGLTASEAEEVKSALLRKRELEENIRGTDDDLNTIAGDKGVEFLAGNMESRLTQLIKSRTAKQWATNYATLTGEEELKMDEVWAKEFSESQQNFRQGRDLQHSYWKDNMQHGEWKADYGLKAQNQQFSQQMDKARYGLDVSKSQREQLKIQLDYEKDNGHWEAEQGLRERQMIVNETAVGIKGYTATHPRAAAGKAGIPAGSSITATGKFTDAVQTRDAVTELQHRRGEIFNTMFNSTFEPGSGAAQMFYANDGLKQQQLFKAANKLKQVREGQQPMFDAEDRKVLDEFAKRFKVPMAIPQNKRVAEEVLRKMNAAMVARMSSQYAVSINGGRYTPEQVKTMRKAMISNMQLSEVDANFQKDLIKVNGMMRNEDGTLKSTYAGATAIGTDSNGQRIYDPSTITDETARRSLGALLPKSYSQTGLSGTSYNIGEKDITPALLATIKPNVALNVRAGSTMNDLSKVKDGDDNLWTKFRAMPPEAQIKAMGKSLEMRINPTRNTTTLVMKIDAAGGYSGAKGSLMEKSGVLEVEIPNARVPQEYQSLVDANTYRWSDRGKATGLDKGRIHNSMAMEANYGVKYNMVHGNGKTYIHFDFENPVEGAPRKTFNVEIPGDPNDKDNAYRLDQYIDSTVEDYLSKRQVFSQQQLNKSKGQLTNFDFLVKNF